VRSTEPVACALVAKDENARQGKTSPTSWTVKAGIHSWDDISRGGQHMSDQITVSKTTRALSGKRAAWRMKPLRALHICAFLT